MLLANITENMESLVVTSLHYTTDYDSPIHFSNKAERHPLFL